MQDELIDNLERHGFQRYEVSAYSLDGFRCQHNLNYWRFGDYLGFGAGAHSKITRQGSIIRSWRQKHPERYMALIEHGKQAAEENTCSNHDLVFEFMLNGLRLQEGVSQQEFTNRTGIRVDTALSALSGAIERNLVDVSEGAIRCTPRGYGLIDEILQDLLPAA